LPLAFIFRAFGAATRSCFIVKHTSTAMSHAETYSHTPPKQIWSM
jgi:hypothetical protein